MGQFCLYNSNCSTINEGIMRERAKVFLRRYYIYMYIDEVWVYASCFVIKKRCINNVFV